MKPLTHAKDSNLDRLTMGALCLVLLIHRFGLICFIPNNMDATHTVLAYLSMFM